MPYRLRVPPARYNERSAVCTLVSLSLLAAPPASATGRDGRYLYVLTCSGCHGIDGSASKEGRVPALSGSIGHFMKTPEARNFLPQAPGIMTSGLNDRDVQALMNWMVPALAGSSLPETFQPYSLEEIGQSRKTKPDDFFVARRAIAQQLKDFGLRRSAVLSGIPENLPSPVYHLPNPF